MKVCPKCNTQLDDNAAFCTSCGISFYQQSAPYTPAYDPYDHTADFDAKDASENKNVAMLGYLLGIVGLIILLLSRKNSPYLEFHTRQIIKISVLEAIISLATVVLVWTLLVPVAGLVCSIILLVVRIICFFQVCAGKTKEPVIVREFSFLR